MSPRKSVGLFTIAAIAGLIAAVSFGYLRLPSSIQTEALAYLTRVENSKTLCPAEAFWPSMIEKLQTKALGEPILFIAHAGGGYKGTHYTNSIDALEQNYREGMRFFEIDFARTSDGKIVCLHNWPEKQYTYEEFNKRKYDPSFAFMKFNNCDLDSLGVFLTTTADSYVILDTKIDREKQNREPTAPFFSEICRYLVEKYNIPLGRLIPQAYNIKETKQFKAEGFPHVILSLYKASLANKKFDEACKLEGVAVTTTIRSILEGYVKVTESNAPAHCPIFVHPIESFDVLAQARKIAPQVKGIYTSFLRPEQP